MKLIPRLSLVCLLLALPLAAQSVVPPPIIESIEPRAAGTEGGTLITITGGGLSLPPNFACVLPCPTMVRFGSAEVPAIHEENTRITVRAPEHAAGTVDLTVRTGDGRSTTVPNGFTFVADVAPGYSTFLLPVHLDGSVPGDRGSLWTTEFWIRNNGPREARLAQWTCGAEVCPPVFPVTYTLRSQETLKDLPPFLQAPSSNVGRLLHVSEADVPHVAMSLRVFDSSRGDIDAGAQLPVVSRDDMHTGTLHLLSVPLDQNFRLHLRIYDAVQRNAAFRVRIYAQEEGVDTNPAPLRDIILLATTSEEGTFRVRPAYAQFTAFGSLLELDIPLDRLRIEIEPQTPGSVFWAFVSITNNETQRLTIVTPQG